jgi:hypothetical protein
VAAIFTLHVGKTVTQIAAIEITVNHLFDIRPPEAMFPEETIIIDSEQRF